MAASGRGESSSQLIANPLPLPPPGSSSYNRHEEHGGPKNKKRAKSIDIEEANQPSLAKLSLYTPTTARSGDPQKMPVCLCAKPPKVPRPRNAFILYRQYFQFDCASENPELPNPEISKLIGKRWHEEPPEVKNAWKQLAEEEKVHHQELYPNYRYQPRRGGKNGSGGPTSSGRETPGRCPKCGGRNIATPNTPITPFGVASPLSSKRPPNMQQPYMNADHSRRGSISGSGMPGDPRRYAHSQLRDIEEDYGAMSPMPGPLSGIPPDAKRRRYNGPPVYVPGSSHMGYAPVDPRYQQHASISGPPMSATGYGPGHLPRPSMQHRPGLYTGHPANPHMQPPPPPRPSMSYQPVSTPNRANSGFDESLRLPPLQTHTNESPVTSSEPGTGRTMVSAQSQQTPSTSMSFVTQGGGPARQPQQPNPTSPMTQKWPFLLKLEVLHSISPPLRPPGPGGPHFETRGPIIAVEGAPTPVLKEVAAVIERALSVSAEFAVKVWSEDTSTAIAHSSPEPHASSSEVNANNNNDNHNIIDGSGNKEGASENGGAIVGLVGQRKGSTASSSLISPIANYVARMLKWHKTSEDLIRYITSYPPAQQQGGGSGGGSGNNDGGSSHSDTTTASSSLASASHRLPVAIMSDGYSLTFSDRYASTLHVNDIYRADDHWQWVATLWRGIVGADLTVYVKRGGAADDGGSGSGSVEIAAPGIMVLRVSDAGRVDEKLERRLGFEIAEWVRGGSFMAGFGKT
ncbi:hypothetical protein F5Y09DRAFT_332936 [Xylaria sp. FL1042]|nr:hypothetical protein F5Y09DRAFT_332936 [Xylaria sp. FL1042]